MDEQQMLDLAQQAGVYRAAIVDVEQITFDPGLRDYCKANVCGNYDRNYACPPCVGEANELIAKARSYGKALVFQTVGKLEDSFDVEGMNAAAENHSRVADEIYNALGANADQSKLLYLTAGGCTLCKRCARVDNLPCRHPGRAISSLEAYCMNVSQLAQTCGMNYINGKDTVTYFGAFLF